MAGLHHAALLLALLQYARAYPDGPPVTIATLCDTMTPQHYGSTLNGPTNAPFSINVSQTCYKSDSALTVTIFATQSTPFKGFFVQAYKSNNYSSVPGQFATSDAGHGLLDCRGGEKTAIGHSNNENKMAASFEFYPGGDDQGVIHFNATIVQRYDTVYLNMTSAMLWPCHMMNSSTSAWPTDHSTTSRPWTTTRPTGGMNVTWWPTPGVSHAATTNGITAGLLLAVLIGQLF